MSGQDAGPGGTFPFSPQDALAFLTKMWNPLGVPVPGFGVPGTPAAPGAAFPNPAAMFAALDPAEVERKIAELRIIENWLAMSLDMMRMSIKTLELQKASLEALAAAHKPMRDAARAEAPAPRKRKG
ncbi:MAG: hypothetical protein KJ018_10665 [Burkholderiales bacterium]|nr:hypothetical protein [Burkholderiales bacterium]